MIEKLITALAQSIRNEFENEWRVYTESVYQALEKPCFFVECEKVERVDMLNRRFLMRVNVKITCENDSEERKNDAQSLSAKLFDLLGCIRVDDCFFNGRKIHGKWESGSFVVRCVYDMVAKKEEEEAEKMLTIETRGFHDGRDGIYKG
ncbi:MAG: hypothetical protein IKU60_00290 [Clostridia bacterium]|nr:hypothetical protein [Clostridia bacterium]